MSKKICDIIIIGEEYKNTSPSTGVFMWLYEAPE